MRRSIPLPPWPRVTTCYPRRIVRPMREPSDPFAGPAITLDANGVEKEAPSPEDIVAALGGERGEDWYVGLWRGDDYIEAMLDRGDLWVECEVGGRLLQARSHVDDEAVKSMFLAFRAGDESWRDLAAWKEPPPRPASSRPSGIVLTAAAAIGLVVFLGIGIALFTGKGGWVVLMFALLFPGVIALAAAVKVAEARRAASWKQARAKIVRSGLVEEKRHDRKVKVPRVEYEFTVGLHRYRGTRVNFAEVLAGPDAAATVASHPVGASVPVYYDPADPDKCVLDRELPPLFRGIWAAVGVLTVLILACGGYYLVR